MDHQWLLPSFTCEKTLCRAVPVAHPGCPMDHVQTLVNRSPGDLWERCIGIIVSAPGILSISEGTSRGVPHGTPSGPMVEKTRYLPATRGYREKIPLPRTRPPPPGQRAGGRPRAALRTVSSRIYCEDCQDRSGQHLSDTMRNPRGLLVRIRPGDPQQRSGIR